ncbi:hypothetical protein CROQUDRAFT_41123 [Cronartium quercuum f. sp. fusiforme G11]|uniref:ubiquitinyl hydrolase 1 n=1 Tax=Cronartium quercuum f. sp. fusiforme G11 TaxID=708437 RepID=A0A9P6NQT4_9BASI|nr:hypothetical protein CROQUDRAFT_41123 [Cronartium quercuum f. sp. fusiforme G11]
MPVTSPSSLIGLPLNTLKAKATVHPDNSLSLLQWVNLANNVYQAAVEADAQQATELAYVEYFKAAGILQVILQHPGFKTMKNQQPANYRIYQEVAPKVLASTDRAKELGEIIESNRLHSNSSASRARPIGGGISSRIKSLEAAGLAGAQSPPNQETNDETLHPPRKSSIASRRPLPVPPEPSQDGITPRTNFVTTALESEFKIRSGSAPPELSVDVHASGDRSGLYKGSAGTSTHRLTGDKVLDDEFFEQTLRSLRSPTEFDQAFPALGTLHLDESNHGSAFFPDLPAVPKTFPTKSRVDLPPPPEPFLLPTYDARSISSTSPSDQLTNDTSLGASLLINGDLDSQAVSSPPPPYPDFRAEKTEPSKTPPLLTRSHAIRNNLSMPRSGPGSLPQSTNSPQSSPRRASRTDANDKPDPPPVLPTGSNEILPAVLIDYFRKMGAAGLDTSVLFLDVRERDDFEACRIKSHDVVCIEPIVLTKSGGVGLTSMEIEESLVISPRREQAQFERRHEFDYVILYDKRSVQLPTNNSDRLLRSNDPTDVPAKLLLILYTAIHKEAYVKRLKYPPMLLSGGMDGWAKVAGESGVIGKGPACSPLHAPRTSFTHSSMNGTPIILRQPVIGSDKIHPTAGNGVLDGASDIKRARRQVALHQRDSPSPQPDLIARSVADLTRLGMGGSSSSHSLHNSSVSAQPGYFNSRPANSPYKPSGYQSPIGVTSPITLPEQTLQRAKSSQPLYDTPIPSHPVDSSSAPYPSSIPIHIASNGYNPSPVPPQSPLYGQQPPLYLAPRQADPGCSSYIPNTHRTPIQYPHFNHHGPNSNMFLGHPPQPPPPAVTPGGGSPNYYHLAPYKSNSSLGRDLISYPRNTPPVTPYSPGTHGPAEVYFNSSFEDGQVGLTGLKNLGNTCYMNSTLQCISATIPLARFFKDGSYKRCINRANPLGTKGLLAESVAELVRVLWGAQYTFVSPITFREAICRFAPQFRGSDQHDAQEFLGFLLDGLHEDLNLVTQKPPPVEMSPAREAELEALPTQLASAREWEIYKRRDNSVIVELFQGQYRSRLQCLTCGTTSTTYNTFMYLSLPIPTGRGMSKVSLTQCLDAFLKEEIMEKDDAWNCPKCKTRRKATKRLSLARLPPILLIHLKRFSFKGPFSDKLEAFVQYPLYGLDLTSYIPPPLDPPPKQKGFKGGGPSMVYDLYAVCNHFGSLSSGHCE